MERIVIATVAVDAQSIQEARTLLASLRTFGGALAQSPFVLMVPESQQGLASLDDAKSDVITFAWTPGDAEFPFALKLAAGAAVEAHLDGAAELVAWMGPETLILSEPRPFLLDTGKAAGGRPVDVCLIGPRWDEPLDPFWEGIFGGSDIPPERFVPVETSVERIRLRNHLNAGLVVVRPERGLLRTWWADFLKRFRQPLFAEYYGKGEYYQPIMHQAVLAGSMLRLLAPHEVEIFPDMVSYPLHLHSDYPTALRPTWLDDAITIRYYFDYDPQLFEKLPAREPLAAWLRAHLLQLTA